MIDREMIAALSEEPKCRTIPLVAVCVITYRGESGLTRLLDSLAAQEIEGFECCIIIVDNDPKASARSVSECFTTKFPATIYEIEPTPGIPAARNRSIEIARRINATYVAFIDDDEYATPGWLAALVARLETSGADAACGPVEPMFPPESPRWASQSRLFHRPSYSAGESLQHASTANAAMRLNSLDWIERPFDDRFQFTGGSDTFLSQQMTTRGGRIVWEPRAQAFEQLPRSRVNMRWLIRRNYRQGITLARCDRMIHGAGRVSFLRLVRGMAMIPAGIAEFLVFGVVGNVRLRRGVTRVSRGFGMIAGLAGATYAEYRRSP